MRLIRSLISFAAAGACVALIGCGQNPVTPASDLDLANKVTAAGIDGPPFDSGLLTPFGAARPQVFILQQPPPSETDVSIGIIVSTDLSTVTEYIRISMNDIDLGTLWLEQGRDCPNPADEAEITIPAETFNTKIQEDGEIIVTAVATNDVNPFQCATSYIRIIIDYCGSGTCPRANPVPGPPRIVSAVSTGNTSVRVTFNEPVYEGAKSSSSYSIVQANVNSESAALRVDGAELSADMTSVTLTTASQNEVTYELIATNIQDLAGNVIAPPDILVNPTRTQFAGTPATNGGPDSDEDGLTDAKEQEGWVVNVRRLNGDIDSKTVTSDPTLEDTDGDGVSDSDEYRNRSNPREADTDGDTMGDNEEWNIVFSDLTAQDSDDDGIDDGLEVGFYKTSPTLADTDGDGLSDGRETLELFRDPRVADLPRPRIRVGQMRLALDERYSFVDETGETVSIESSSQSSFAESDSTKFSTSDSTTNEKAREAFIKGKIEAKIAKDPSLTIGAEGGYKWNWQDSHTYQTSSESARESQRTYENSLNKGLQFSRTSQVTREIVGASLQADLTFENVSDLSFTISNIQISVLQRSRFSLTDYVPIATLVPESQVLTGDDLVLNLGPLVPRRGPIIFANTQIFPSLVEDLMSSPRGLIFEIANFDMTDEFGRNFAFASQEARDRSAGLVIDRGDGDPVRVLVALNGQIDDQEIVGGGFIGGFDARGRAVGLPLDYVFQDILGYEKNRRTPDAIVAGKNFRADTTARGDDVQLIPKGTGGLLPHDIIITAGPNGVLDTTPEADPQGSVNDRPEVTTGYETSPTCGPRTPEAIIEPLRFGDGIAHTTALDDDVQVIPVGGAAGAGALIVSAGPDGVIDSIPDGDDVAIFPGQIGKPDGIAEPMTGGNGRANSSAIMDDIQLVPLNAVVTPGQRIIDPGVNGFIDTPPGGDDVLISRDCGNYPTDGKEVLARFENRRSGDFRRAWMVLVDRNVPLSTNFGDLILKPGDDISIAFLQDQDRDGLFAQEEFMERSSDTDDDSDDDRLDDFAEIKVGWDVGVTGGLITAIRPDASLLDSDGDGLPDWFEQDLRRLFGNPADELSFLNFDGTRTTLTPSQNPMRLHFIPISEFDDIFETQYTSPNPFDPNYDEDRIISCNPRLADSDSDGLSDQEEMYGYTVGLSVRAGSNGVCNTEALGDDVQKVIVAQQAYNNNNNPPGNPLGGVVILPGPNHVIDSNPGTDQPGDPNDDVRDLGHLARTNPLDPDWDGDTRPDGRERDLGGDPKNAGDSDDFIDTDGDGLSDAEEAFLGWDVVVANPNCTPTNRHVTSNKFVPDTDLDGLPDLVERLIASDPTREDTDCDGLGDYDEFDDFERYLGYAQQFPRFELNGTNSARYGTNLNSRDTDGDTITDQEELTVGWRVMASGFDVPRQVYPDPRFADTDLDGLSDLQERTAGSDPRDADTDDDGRTDGSDSSPLSPNIRVFVSIDSWDYDSITGSCEGEDGSRWRWSYVANINGANARSLFNSTGYGCADACGNACAVAENVYRIFPGPGTEVEYSMQPGDLLIIDGYACNVRASCSINCDCMDLLQTFSYEALAGGSSSVVEVVDVRGRLESLTGHVTIFIRVQ